MRMGGTKMMKKLTILGKVGLSIPTSTICLIRAKNFYYVDRYQQYDEMDQQPNINGSVVNNDANSAYSPNHQFSETLGHINYYNCANGQWYYAELTGNGGLLHDGKFYGSVRDWLQTACHKLVCDNSEASIDDNNCWLFVDDEDETTCAHSISVGMAASAANACEVVFDHRAYRLYSLGVPY